MRRTFGPQARLAALTVALLASAASNAQVTPAPEVQLAHGQPRYVGRQPVAPTTSTGAAARQAPSNPNLALASYGTYFGLANPLSELEEHRVYADGDASVRRYRQLHYGLPVIGGELVLAMDGNGQFRSLSGEIGTDLSLPSLTAQIQAADAQQIALAAIAKYRAVPMFTLGASTPELSVYDAALLSPQTAREAELVWRVEVLARAAGIDELVLVDATTGAIPLHFNQIDFVRDRMTYTANMTTSLPGTLVCDESQPNCTNGVNADADLAHQYAGDTYDFYFDNHGRDSFDDAGATLISTVEYQGICPNAFWNGTQMVYCPGAPQADDVVGHELTHAVTENTSALYYFYQSGAINESFSDVWGELIDLTNGSGTDTAGVRWLLGEDFAGVGAIRDMANPPAFGDPDRMQSPNYWTYPSDQGGVHYNSGVNNKALSLLVDGGSFNGYNVTGIGIDKAAAIYYRVQTEHLTSGSDYADLYVALNQACQNLIGTGGIVTADCFEVANATGAVEMNLEPLFDAGSEAEVCPVGQVPSDVYFNGFETPADFALWAPTSIAGTPINSWVQAFGYAPEGIWLGYAQGEPTATDYTLQMNASVVLPADAFLHFRHAFLQETDPITGTFFDGGFVEVSTDNGATWVDAVAYYDSGEDYTGTLYDMSGNPQGGRDAFVGDSHGYQSTRYDFSSLPPGTPLMVRFRNTSDLNTYTGLSWLIDAVRIYTCVDDSTPNTPPVADAGTDQTVAPGVQVTLDGSASTDPDGAIISYQWSQTSGPQVTLTPVGASAVFQSPGTPAQEVLQFDLTVTDGRGDSDTDAVSVTVINGQPTADAGADLDQKPGDLVTLQGTASDPGGTIASYLWTQLSGPTATLFNATSATASFFAPGVVSSDTLEFRFTATDNFGAVASDDVLVNLVNDQPVADAGPDLDQKPGDFVALQGTATDPDGFIASYGWVQLSGPPATLMNATSPTASFVAPGVVSSATLEFQFTATDNYGAVATDVVLVGLVNDQPTADAGADLAQKPEDIVFLQGAASDPDGSIASYDWTQLSGPAVPIMNASSATASFVAPAVLSNEMLEFRLTATDEYGATATDDVAVIVTNDQPVADAGPDLSSHPRATVQLQGSASDVDGGIDTYQWVQKSGPSVALTDGDTATPTFDAPSVLASVTLSFDFTATDRYGASATDSVDVLVTNDPPSASAGADRNVAAGASVTLDGSGSSDSDGPLASYNWTQTAGPSVSLSSANSLRPQFTAPSLSTGSTLTFRFSVTDADGATDEDFVSIAVAALAKKGGGGSMDWATLLALLTLALMVRLTQPDGKKSRTEKT